MANISARSNGKWRAQVRMGGHKLDRTFPYRWQAVRWADGQEEAIRETGAPLVDEIAVPEPEPLGTGLTVHQYANEWLAGRVGLEPATEADYRRAIKWFDRSALWRKPITKLTRADVDEWRGSMLTLGTGRPTINRRVVVLRAVCRSAVLAGALDSDPTAGLAALNTDLRVMRTLTGDEVEKLLANAGDDLAAQVLIAHDGGLRFAEVIGLTRYAVDLDGGWLHVTHVVERLQRRLRAYPKAGSKRRTGTPYRSVPIVTDRLRAALTRLVENVDPETNPSRLLFTEPPSPRHGTTKPLPLRYDTWRGRSWEPLMAATRLDPQPRFHDLRHSYGTNLARAGVPLIDIARLMGHADLTTTQIYLHASGDNALADRVRIALSN